MNELRGRTALVTGAAGVLGAATARILAARGLRLVLVDIDAAGLEAVATGVDADAQALKLDVSDADAVAAAGIGDVDVLVNNAGVLSNNKAVQTTPEEWRRVMGVNLDGAFYMARQFLPGMKARRWGRIVNICSLASKTGGLTAGTAYTASKGGMAALTFSLAREAAGDGVTVNGIAPAYIKTPMVTDQLSEAQRRKLLRDIPVGRFCDAEEVAHVVDFLVSPLSGFITGEIIDINGGLHLD